MLLRFLVVPIRGGNILRENLLAVLPFSQLVVFFILVAERGGVLGLVGPLIGAARLRLDAVDVNETKVCCLAPFLVPILLNLKLI